MILLPYPNRSYILYTHLERRLLYLNDKLVAVQRDKEDWEHLSTHSFPKELLYLLLDEIRFDIIPSENPSKNPSIRSVLSVNFINSSNIVESTYSHGSGFIITAATDQSGLISFILTASSQTYSFEMQNNRVEFKGRLVFANINELVQRLSYFLIEEIKAIGADPSDYKVWT